MQGKSKDDSQINIKSKSDVVAGGDVVGGDKTPINEDDLVAGQDTGGGVTITATRISISGDVVGGSKTVFVESKVAHPINCPNCGRSYLPAENKFACPNCGTATPKFF